MGAVEGMGGIRWDYLVGVESPEGEEVPNYHSQVVLTAEEVRTAALAQYPGADLSGDLGVVLAAGGKFSRRSGLRGSGRRHPHRERGADSVRAPLRQLFRVLGRGSLHL